MTSGQPQKKSRSAQRIEDVRLALYSGNYNFVRDGANQALNRLVDYLLRRGAKVRVYSPTTDAPAFAPTGDLVSVASFALPGRDEYRFPTHMSRAARADLDAFAPNMVQISSPDFVGHRMVSFARRQSIPVLASVHTRFETYPRYYRMGFLEPVIEAMLRRLYRRCDALVAPSASMAEVLRRQRMNDDIGIWSRGVDRDVFHPDRRDADWRQGHGISDGEPVIGFLGRLVMEKGLDVFADTIATLKGRNVAHRVLVVGEGPAEGWFREHVPGAVFAGFQEGDALGRAVASMDMLFNPSVTETFGNVTLEAMACGLPVVAADATGSDSLVRDGETGALVAPGRIDAFADALQRYCEDAALRRDHGAAGERRADEYSWDQINQTVADTYLRLIANRQSGAT